MEKQEATLLAEKIAEDIFKCGGEPDSPCRRIQFMGGIYPDNEINQGGLIKGGLIIHIKETLLKT